MYCFPHVGGGGGGRSIIFVKFSGSALFCDK